MLHCWKGRPENPFPEVPQSSCIFWDARNQFLRHFNFFDFRPARQKPKNDAETATFSPSLEENSPWNPAQIKERPTWRSIAGSRALDDQMAPQLCLFYISAKFDLRPTRQHNIENTKKIKISGFEQISKNQKNPFPRRSLEIRISRMLLKECRCSPWEILAFSRNREIRISSDRLGKGFCC